MDANEQRTKIERYGPMAVGVAVLGSAVIVGGWWLLSDRGGGAKVDMGGFDIAAAPESRRGVAASAGGSVPTGPASSLGMVRRDEDMSAGNAPPAPVPTPTAPQNDPRAEAVATFRDAVIKNESNARAFSYEMEKKYPSITQYGRDWVSYPDLRELTLQWHRDKDSMKFAYGVAKSENFSKIVQKYAADPGVRAYILEGVKQAPMDLVGAVGNVCSNDGVLRDLAATVAKAAGLPPSVTALIGGTQPGTQAPDASKVVGEILNDPRNKTAPPVSIKR